MSMILARSNCPDEVTAREIGRELVKRQLAACVSIMPIVASIYSWEGNLEENPEFQLLIKSDSALMGKLEQALVSLHPYETPEFIVSSVDHVSNNYLSWVNESLGLLSE